MAEILLKDPVRYFWLRSGKGLRSIRELANYLPSMPDEEFRYHWGPPRYDFSNWVEYVFGERELAAKMRKCRSRQEFQSVIYNHLIHGEIREKRQEKVVRRADDERAVIEDPGRFASFHTEDAKRKDALADRFDAVTHRFSENAHPATAKEMEQRLETLTERHREIRRRIAEARKAAKDPFIADLTLRPVPAKLEYARLSEDEKDFRQIALIMDEAERELQEALAFTEPDAKGDVERLLRDDVSGGLSAASSGVRSAAHGDAAATQNPARRAQNPEGGGRS